MAKYLIAVPASIYITLTDEDLNGKDVFNLELDDDILIDAVFAQHSKYITVDARNLGYDNYQIVDSFDE
jgi:hypothetical protein